MGKALGILVLGALGALAVLSWPDMKRYFRIEELSWGKGHPELVPIEGRHVYLKNANGAAAGGADFAPASRGGPVREDDE